MKYGHRRMREFVPYKCLKDLEKTVTEIWGTVSRKKNHKILIFDEHLGEGRRFILGDNGIGIAPLI